MPPVNRRPESSSVPPRDPFPTHAEIAARAQQLTMNSPSSLRTATAHWWRQAEDELLHKAARRVISSDFRNK